jgi:hypothetical protein
VTVSSSDTNEALELLTLELGRGDLLWPSMKDMSDFVVSRTGSEWLKHWLEANDMVASVYISMPRSEILLYVSSIILAALNLYYSKQSQHLETEIR